MLVHSESDSSLAVRLALAETEVINETKRYLEGENVNLDAFLGEESRQNLSSTVILIKNLPFATSNDDIRKHFGRSVCVCVDRGLSFGPSHWILRVWLYVCVRVCMCVRFPVIDRFGEISRLLVPPSRALALLEFQHAHDAKKVHFPFFWVLGDTGWCFPIHSLLFVFLYSFFFPFPRTRFTGLPEIGVHEVQEHPTLSAVGPTTVLPVGGSGEGEG